MKGIKGLSDSEAFEFVKKRALRMIEKAADAFDQGSSFNEGLECAREGMRDIVLRVAEADIREIGHFSFERSGRHYLQWVYRDRKDREKVYCIGWPTRLMFARFGYAEIRAFEEDQRKKN